MSEARLQERLARIEATLAVRMLHDDCEPRDRLFDPIAEILHALHCPDFDSCPRRRQLSWHQEVAMHRLVHAELARRGEPLEDEES